MAKFASRVINFGGGGVAASAGPTIKLIWGSSNGAQTNVGSSGTNLDLNFDGGNRFEFDDFDELMFLADNGGSDYQADIQRIPTFLFTRSTNRVTVSWNVVRSGTNNWLLCAYVSASRCRISGAAANFGMRAIYGIKYPGGIVSDSSPT